MDIIKRTVAAIAAIVLFSVYVFIFEGVYNFGNNRGFTDIMFFCICLSVLVTLIYFFVSEKFLGLRLQTVNDYCGQMLVCLFADFLAYLYHGNTMERTGFFFIDDLLMCIFYIVIFVIGGVMYFPIGYLTDHISNRTYGDLRGKVLSAIMGFLLYIAITFIPKSWFNNIESVIVWILILVIIGIVTVVFRFISEKVMKASFKNSSDHIFLLCLFVWMSFILLITYNVVCEGDLLNILEEHCIEVILAYIIGNGFYDMIKSMRSDYKDRKSGDANKSLGEENINKDMNEDGYMIGKISSEIILIPGIDEDMNEVKKDSASTGNSRDT